MTDLRRDDAAFEQELRAVLADLAPDVAPGSLRASVAALPRQLGRPGPTRSRALLAVLGIAAVLAVLVASFSLSTGRRVPPVGGPPPGSAAPASSPSSGTATLTFDVVTPDGSMASKDQVLAVEDVMDARLHAYGVGLFSSSASDDRITYEVPLPHGDATTVDSLREVLGTTGVFSIALLGADPVDVGARVTVPPLVTGDAVTDARTGVDQGGTPTLDLTFDAAGSAALAGTTRTHVGEYLAVALDGIAVTVPVINEEIPDGRLQITFASDDTLSTRLAPIVSSGPLPLPVEAVTP
jgi:hypothetical protein